MSVISSLVEVKLIKDDDFLKVKETLTRIGVASKKDNTLFQSCHILHKQGKYYIVHFKELFALDGKDTDFSDEDKGRRNVIASLLDDWGLVSLVDKTVTESPRTPMSRIKVIPHKEKESWNLKSKYTIGNRKATTN
jgi:hypothetical protein